MTVSHVPPTLAENAEKSISIIQDFAASIPETPGVYQMHDNLDRILYIGKAKNLKKRILSYTQLPKLTQRTLVMLSHLDHLTVSHTRSESEALLLEMNLIKSQKPRYNILLRDDKTFPYILIRKNHPFPQILITREKQRNRGSYYGPFGSGLAAHTMIEQLQKAFLIRNCSDNTFSSRSRPCLLHQIKRCAAPCVGLVDQQQYKNLIQQSKNVIKGNTKHILASLSTQMENASKKLQFEEAARLRDRIRTLLSISSESQVHVQSLNNCDVIGLVASHSQACVHVFFYRNGHPYGSRSLFPKHDSSDDLPHIMLHIIGQLYTYENPPPHILVNILPHEHLLLEQALSQTHRKKIRILKPQQGPRHDKVQSALHAAEEALHVHIREKSSHIQQLKALAELLKWTHTPQLIEIFDNSHLQGTHALGAMVVSTPDGFQKNRYRKFNMESQKINTQDDIAMMYAMISRRFSSLKNQDPEQTSNLWPDLIIIDGGKNQLNAAIKALKELNIQNIKIIGIAKTIHRNAGNETLFVPPSFTPITLPTDSHLLFFLQRLRDESHRFAITSHRKKRQRALRKSTLDDIPGIGAKRKQKLIRHFGSAKATSLASLKELQTVEGISTQTAKTIHQYFHGNLHNQKP
jgi:excinuclease ABC subunit C